MTKLISLLLIITAALTACSNSKSSNQTVQKAYNKERIIAWNEDTAQTPNYTGTWVLNLEKSQLEDRPEGLTSTVFIIKQEGDKFSLTRYHIFGKKKKKISFTMVADGKTRKVKVLFKGKLERKEHNLKATLWRKNFSNIVDYKFGINQNELIADEVFTSKASNHHNIWVFNREIPK